MGPRDGQRRAASPRPRDGWASRHQGRGSSSPARRGPAERGPTEGNAAERRATVEEAQRVTSPVAWTRFDPPQRKCFAEPDVIRLVVPALDEMARQSERPGRRRRRRGDRA